jgi:UDP-glucose 4-epimerase
MRVLVTGSRGKIGSIVASELAEQGHEVERNDLALGDDMRDGEAVNRATRGCEAVVHLAAFPRDVPDRGDEVFQTNLLGTFHVLGAAREHRPSRVVFVSSVNALGVFTGHRRPDYLPIDDAHPSYARTPYAQSKHLGEEMCEVFTRETGITTICLRLPAVLTPEDINRRRERWRADPQTEWTPIWEYGAWLHVRDAATASARALVCPDPRHIALLLCADDIAATAPGRELAARLLPEVPWRGGPEYDQDPYRALVDIRLARAVLDWQPRYRWRPAETT